MGGFDASTGFTEIGTNVRSIGSHIIKLKFRLRVLLVCGACSSYGKAVGRAILALATKHHCIRVPKACFRHRACNNTL